MRLPRATQQPDNSFLAIDIVLHAGNFTRVYCSALQISSERDSTLIPIFFFLNKFIYLFIYFWLCWVFVSVRGLSPVAASGGHSSSRCAGLSLSRPLPLRSTGSRRAGSAVVAHGLSCSMACGIFPGQGSNPRPLHWQADPQPLRHQGSPLIPIFEVKTLIAREVQSLAQCHTAGTCWNWELYPGNLAPECVLSAFTLCCI